ncbi:hypothetical protein M0804_007466 [Polistes exclamans]|nr:hypothetical protein M0804_007466 [Polistes exclamans]
MTEEFHLRNCMLYEYMRGTKVLDATKNIQKALGEYAVDYYRCEKWFNKFRKGFRSLKDDSDDEEEIITSLKIKYISTIQTEQATTFFRSMQNYEDIIGSYSYYLQRCRIADYLLETSKHNKLFREIVILDELCVSYVTLHCTNINVSEVEKSNGKIYTKLHNAKISFWWNFRGFLHLELLPKNKILTDEFYSKQFDKLHEILLLKEPGPVLSKYVILQHDIDQLYSTKVLEKMSELGYKILPQPYKSPDFNCSSYLVLPTLKKQFEGKFFPNEELLIQAIIKFLGYQTETFYSQGITHLIQRWKNVYTNFVKCITK